MHLAEMPFLQDVRERFIAIRVRLKKGRRVNPVPPVNPISAGGETGSSVLTTGSTVLRAAKDGIQEFGPVVAAVITSVPIAGPPLAAAISGLAAILRGIDRYEQNKSDLDDLKFRLIRLSGHLRKAPSPLDIEEQEWRDLLTSILNETSDELTQLDKSCARYTARVTQAITGCSNRIKEYLDEYMLTSQMQMKHKLHVMSIEMQSMQRLMTRTLGIVTLVDATGYEHSISVEYCTSFDQFNKMLGVVLERDLMQAKIQKLFLATGEYNLCIDDGRETTQLTSDNWVSVPAGTKVVMGVVVKQPRGIWSSAGYQLCYFCRTMNYFALHDKQKVVSMDCMGCKRRIHISITKPEIEGKEDIKSERREIKLGKISDCHASEVVKMQLIQNFHFKHVRIVYMASP